MSDAATTTPTRTERDELVALLDKHRGLFLLTTQGMSDEQARETPTVSALSLGGLVKHVASTVDSWLDLVEGKPQPTDDIDWSDPDPALYETFANGFRLLEDETLAGATAEFVRVAERTDALVRSVDLDEVHALPPAPWFGPDEAWSNRRVFIHVLAETAQHAGHADIIRETIDGQKSMG